VGRLDAPFAYATGVAPDGHHSGLVFRSLGRVFLDEQSILIHPDHVVKPPPPEPEGIVEPGRTPDGSALAPQPLPPAPAKVTSRYFGRVTLDSQRVNREMSLIVEEVVERLTSLVGVEVEISLELQAWLPEGFDEATIRTISENSRTLKFDNFGFESE